MRRMLLPPDWDVPPKDNDKLVKCFISGRFERGKVSLPYRLFIPRERANVPLVLYLHGADAAGTDNTDPLSMHAIGTLLARPQRQRKDPCYIIAPQYAPMQHWSVPEIADAVTALLEETIHNNPSIDPSRIYLYGYSAGGVGSLHLIKEHPSFFAAAVIICGATGRNKLENLIGTPIKMFHAADDNIVKASYYNRDDPRPLTHLGSRDIYAALKGEAPDLSYTEFSAGRMKEEYGVNPHCSWVALSDPDHEKVWDWMFEQRRERTTS